MNATLDIDEEIAQLEGRRDKLMKLQRLRLSVAALEGNKIEGLDMRATFNVVMSAVENDFSVGLTEMMSKLRTERIALARQVGFYLIRQMTDFSLAAIGRLFEKDHGTVMYGIRAVENRMSVDMHFRERVLRLVYLCKQDLGLNLVSVPGTVSHAEGAKVAEAAGRGKL